MTGQLNKGRERWTKDQDRQKTKNNYYTVCWMWASWANRPREFFLFILEVVWQNVHLHLRRTDLLLGFLTTLHHFLNLHLSVSQLTCTLNQHNVVIPLTPNTQSQRNASAHRLAPPRVHSTTSRQQSPECSVLGQVDCFSSWQPVGVKLVLSNLYAGQHFWAEHSTAVMPSSFFTNVPWRRWSFEPGLLK